MTAFIVQWWLACLSLCENLSPKIKSCLLFFFFFSLVKDPNPFHSEYFGS